MKKLMKRAASVAMAALLSMSLLAGCGKSNETVANPALTFDGEAFSMEEALFYTYTMRLQYETYYGPEFWDMELEEGKTYGDELKTQVQDSLVKMLVLNAKADDYKVKLGDEDMESITAYIESFKEAVTEEEMAEEGITEEIMQSTLEKIYTASYVFDAMVADEEVELTDEEKADAVCRRVQHILITTTETTKQDADGNPVEMTEDEIAAYKEERKAFAESVLEKAQAGEDFKALSDEYTSENAGFEFAFDKYGFDPVNYSYMVEAFYTASWELAEGEISGLVESDYGYHIIKCVSENDETATQAALDLIESELQYTAFDETLQQMTAEAQYTISDAWKDYKITSKVVEETAVETTVETSEETTEETEE